MGTTVFSETIEQAAAIEGSTQALASALNVPETTLLRWMQGRAQPPIRAWLRALEIVTRYERNTVSGAAATQVAPAGMVAASEGPPGPLTFAFKEMKARCHRCDGTEFRMLEIGPLKYTSVLACCTCGTEVVHGDLIVALANDVWLRSRSAVASLKGKQKALSRKTTAAKKTDRQQ